MAAGRAEAKAADGHGAFGAANEAIDEGCIKLDLQAIGLGQVSLPPLDHMAFYAGVGILAAVELVEWPVALVLTVGKVLADNRTNKTVRAFGRAFESAG